jgi:hypothetical protein
MLEYLFTKDPRLAVLCCVERSQFNEKRLTVMVSNDKDSDKYVGWSHIQFLSLQRTDTALIVAIVRYVSFSSNTIVLHTSSPIIIVMYKTLKCVRSL